MYYASSFKKGSVILRNPTPHSNLSYISITLSEDLKKDKKLVKGISGKKRS